MAKNFFKTFFNSNKDKNLYLKNPKIAPSYKLSEIVTNTKSSEDSKILPQQQQPIDSYNLLLNYYSKKDEQNNIINNFMEKISKLNKKFHASSEKFIITKTSYDKLSDELFLNLFKQIDTYVEEIQRLNKKISLIDNKDNKLIIKNLTKELNENKEKIRNYEIKLREKTSKEEKLLKDIEYYKRRIIFFKNKININLMVRNTSGGRSRLNQKNRNDNNIIKTSSIKMTHSNNYNSFSRGNISKNKDRKIRKYLSPPKMTSKDILSENCFSSKNMRTFFQNSHGGPKGKLYQNEVRNNIDNVSYNTFTNFKSINEANEEENSQNNQITANNKLRGFFSDGEPDDISTRKLIKIRKSSKKENIIVPFKKIKVNKNYNKDDDDNFEFIYSENKNCNNIGNGNDDGDINKNINIDENKKDKKAKEGNNLGKDLKSYSPMENERNNKFFENIIDETSYNSEKGEKKVKRVKYKSKTGKNEEKKILSYSSTLNINNNKNKLDKTNLDNSKTSNKQSKNLKINTLKKPTNTKKIFNYPSKKFFASPKNISFNNSQNSSIYNPQNTIETNYKNNTINQDKSNLLKVINTDNNNINNNNEKNTIEDTKNKTMENNTNKNNNEAHHANQVLKNKTVKFKPDDVSEKEQKLQFTTSESENCEMSGRDLPKIKQKLYKSVCNSGNFSDNISKGGTNNDNLSLGDNSLILKKDKKIENNKKNNLMNNKKSKNKNNKQNTIKKNPIIEKDFKLEQKNKQKDKELGKILKEMNEDYINDIEMLKRQEEQIKLMLNLINLNEGEN